MYKNGKDKEYLKEAALQYASYRLRTFVLYVGSEDQEYLSRLAHKGCTLVSLLYRPRGPLSERQYAFHGRGELLQIMNEKLPEYEFDTVLLQDASRFCELPMLELLREMLIRLNRGGTLLILDQYHEEIPENYSTIIEVNDKGEALYLFADHLNEDNLQDWTIRVKMEKPLSQTPRFSLGLVGDNLRREDLHDLSAAMYEAIRHSPDYHGESFYETMEEVRNVMNGRYGQWLQEASLCLRRRGEIVSAMLVSLYRSQPLITFVFTRSEHQRQGHAKRLIEASMMSLRNRGYRKLIAFHTLGSEAPRALLDSLGFVEAGRSME